MKATKLLVIFAVAITGIANAQFQTNDLEINLTGAYSHQSLDDESMTTIALTAGFGKFVSPAIQIGIEPTWLYQKYTAVQYDYDFDPYTWDVEETSSKETYSDGQLGITLFTNFNIETQSKISPYLTAQYQIMDIAPPSGLSIGDFSYLGFGGGLRYFIIENTAINTKLLYSLPLKDAKYKSKPLTIQIGLSVIL